MLVRKERCVVEHNVLLSLGRFKAELRAARRSSGNAARQYPAVSRKQRVASVRRYRGRLEREGAQCKRRAANNRERGGD